MENQEVKTAYQTAKSDIANLLGFFECELGKQPQTIQWPQLQTLRQVRQNLIEALSFLSGFEAGQIENTLEESRL